MKALPAVRENRLRVAMREKRVARGFHMIFPSPNVVELLGCLDFDLVYLDAEHGRFDLGDIEEACRAAEISGITPIARIPADQLSLVGLFLDRGVQGLIVPHVTHADQARRIVDACFYRPVGHRSNGGARADRYWYGVRDYDRHFADSNENTTLSIQIEDREGIENLDDILSVPGIDYYTIGKNDLTASYDQPRLDSGFTPLISEIVADAERRIRAAGKPMKDDVMKLGRVKDFLLGGGRDFLSGAA